jgi:hypothetical protein
MEQVGPQWADFHEIWYLSVFRKSDEKNQFSLLSDNLDNMDIVRRLQRKKTLWASLSDSAKTVTVLEQVLV